MPRLHRGGLRRNDEGEPGGHISDHFRSLWHERERTPAFLTRLPWVDTSTLRKGSGAGSIQMPTCSLLEGVAASQRPGRQRHRHQFNHCGGPEEDLRLFFGGSSAALLRERLHNRVADGSSGGNSGLER